MVDMPDQPQRDHGCIVLSKSFIPVLKNASSSEENGDIMTHFVPKLIGKGLEVIRTS